MFKITISTILFLCFFISAGMVNATVYLQDNFDNCTVNCTAYSVSVDSPPNSPSIGAWTRFGGGGTNTFDSVTHNTGEISVPGRGGTGRSLKSWKYGSTATGYNGTLTMAGSQFPANKSKLFFRFYMKIPVDLSTSSTTGVKLFRLLVSGADVSTANVIYFNILPNPSGPLNRDNAELGVALNNSWLGYAPRPLNNAQMKTLMWDGEWHCHEFEVDLQASNVVKYYVDGNLTWTSPPTIQGGVFTEIGHSPVGNCNCTSYQNSWQAIELDDIVIADEYIGPDGGSPPDPTPIINSITPLTVSSGQDFTINGQNLASEDTASWNSQFRTGTAYGFEGTSPTSDGYTAGPVNASYSAAPTYSSSVKLSGSNSLATEIWGLWSGSNSPGSYLVVPSGTTTGDRWVRAYMRFDLTGGSFPSQFMRLFSSTTTGQYHLSTIGSNNFMATWPVSGSAYNLLVPSPDGTILEDKWYLVEMHWKTSDPRTYELYIDGSLRATGTNMSTAEITNILFPLVGWDGTTSDFHMRTYVDNFAISSARIGPSSLVEISNNSTYHQGTYKYQTPVAISDTAIQVKADLTGLGSGPFFLWVTNNRGQTVGPYNISGEVVSDTTPPVTSAAPVGGSYLSSQTISLSCSDNQNCASTQYCWGVSCTPSTTYGSPLAIQNGTLGYRSTDAVGNLEITKYNTYTIAVSDTTAPQLSDLSPYGELPYGSTTATLRVTSSEDATCRYDASNTAYSSMSNTFSTTNNLQHSAQLTGLVEGNSYTYNVACVDSSQNISTTSSINFSISNTAPTNSILFQEHFEDSNWAARGWYEAIGPGIISSEGYVGNAFQWTWLAGSQGATNVSTMRRQFTPTETLYVSFFIKLLPGWVGSLLGYHPHMIHILSDLDDRYQATANNYLNAYIELISDTSEPYYTRPRINLQDNVRINYDNGTTPNDLRAVTENRSVAKCNTPVPTGAIGDCYGTAPNKSSYTIWDAPSGTVPINSWTKVEVYLQMNTIVDGIGQTDGIMQVWLDNSIALDRHDIIYRTNQDATKKFAQFIFAPYIGVPGSPINQSLLFDELTVAQTRSLAPVIPPGHVKLNAPTPVDIDNPTQVPIMQ